MKECVFGVSVKTRLMECDTDKINFYTDPKYYSAERAYIYAERNLASGTAIPQTRVAAVGEEFYKVVPRGAELNSTSPYLM